MHHNVAPCVSCGDDGAWRTQAGLHARAVAPVCVLAATQALTVLLQPLVMDGGEMWSWTYLDMAGGPAALRSLV